MVSVSLSLRDVTSDADVTFMEVRLECNKVSDKAAEFCRFSAFTLIIRR